MLAYASGEAAAFDVLYARHKGGVYRYVLRHCGNSGLADELFQDIWMSVIRVRTTYAPTAKFATSLYTLAHNRIIDHWRASGHTHLVSIDDDADESTRAAVDALPAARGDEPHVRADNVCAHGEIRDVALYARAQSNHRSLAREWTCDARVGRR